MAKIQIKDIPSQIDGKMTLPFEMKSFSKDDKYFYFEGYLSTFDNVDRGKDVVVKGAFVESLKQHMPSLLWSHKGSEPLGIFESMVEDEVGLYVKGKMPLADEFVSKRIVPQMEIGSIKSMSIGYSIWGAGGAEHKGDVRYLKKLFLWEGSLVTIPMNDQANLKTKAAMGYKEELPVADRNTIWDEQSALGRVRDWAGAEDGGLQDPEVQEKFRDAFLWHDHEDPDWFDSYKLLIADIVDGKLTVVPRAVFAAAARLKGARGGVYFWFPEDRPRVMNTVEKYYSKIGLDSPFGKSFRIDDFKAHCERDLEKLFKSGATMSRKSAMILVSALKLKFSTEENDADESLRDVSDGLGDILSDLKSITENLTK